MGKGDQTTSKLILGKFKTGIMENVIACNGRGCEDFHS